MVHCQGYRLEHEFASVRAAVEAAMQEIFSVKDQCKVMFTGSADIQDLLFLLSCTLGCESSSTSVQIAVLIESPCRTAEDERTMRHRPTRHVQNNSSRVPAVHEPCTSTYVEVRRRTTKYVDVRRRMTTYVDVRGKLSLTDDDSLPLNVNISREMGAPPPK